MKRIIRFCLCLTIALPTGLLANTHFSVNTTDTSSYIPTTAKSLTIRGTLSSFNAAYGRNYFDLNWNTVAGDFDHFEVERSLDGQKYETIGTVDMKSAVEQGQYNYRDHFRTSTALNNDFYYRLKQVEPNGTIVYSKVLIARMYNTRSLASMSVTPDPEANDILVNVQLNQSAYIVMKVTDENGNLILKEGKKADNGTNTYTLEGTHDLHRGIYTLEVTVNSRERMTMKLAKG